MFKLEKHGSATSEVSYQENRDLHSCETSPVSLNFARAFLVRTAIDARLLQESLHVLAMRHEALRTRYMKKADGHYARDVQAESDLQLRCQVFDAEDAADESVQRYIQEAVSERFTPYSYPLFRVHALSLRGEQTIIVLAIAQVISDASSFSILIEELNALYAAKACAEALPPVTHSLSDMVMSHNAWRASPDYSTRLSAIGEQLCKELDARGGVQQLIFEARPQQAFQHYKEFPAGTSEIVRKLGAEHKISPATFFSVLSVSGVAKARGRSAQFFTTSFSNRHCAGTERLVAHIATTMPYCVDVRAEESLLQQLKRWQLQFLTNMNRYAMIPVQEVVESVTRSYASVIPPGQGLKFGQVTVNVLPAVRVPDFSGVTEDLPTGNVRGVSNDFNFRYGTTADGKLFLRLLGRQQNTALGEQLMHELVPDAPSTLMASLNA